MFGFSQSATALAFVVLLTTRPCSADPPAPNATNQTPPTDTIADSTAPTPEQIQAWIKQLGDADFSSREKAADALIAAGNAAFDPVLAAKKNNDPEIRARAKAIEERLIRDAVKHLKGLGAGVSGRPFKNDEIDMVSLYNRRENREIDDDDIAPIARFRQLEVVQLHHLSITDATLKNLTPFDELKNISLVKADISEQELLRFLRGKSQLTELTLAGCPVGDETAKMLLDFPALKLVNFAKTHLTDEGMAHLARHPSLETMFVMDTEITSAGIRALAPLKNQLVFLNASGTKIDNAAAKEFAALTNLDLLQFDRTKLTDDALVHLQPLKKLTRLRLHGCDITDAGLAHLSSLPKLEHLGLDGTRITADCTDTLREFPVLRTLDVPVGWSEAEIAKAHSNLKMNKKGNRITIEQHPKLIPLYYD